MTSKNLFIKRMKQDLEQRIWLPVVYFIINFLVMEMAVISTMDYWKGDAYFYNYMEGYLQNTLFSPGSGLAVLTMCVALISAISGFSYMHSAKKLDVYHSIPIKREKLFFQQYIYGIIYFLVPLMLHVLITMGICAANGIGGSKIWGSAGMFLLAQLFIYLAVYSVTILSVCLTGNIVVNVLGAAVLLCYSQIIELIKLNLMNEFYMTFYGGYVDTLNVWAFSPIHLFYKMVGMEYSEYWWYFLKFLLMAAIYTGIALFLYKKRPSETAGKSIAFPVTEPVIKAMVVFPASINFGEIFRSIVSNGNEFGWFVSGCIFGFLLVTPMMEIIFRKDVKAVFSHPLQIVFNGVCVIGVILVFRYDWLGYDSYIPDADKVDSYAVYIGEFTGVYPVGGNGATEYHFDYMKMKDNESMRLLAEHGAEITRTVRNDEMGNNAEAYSEFLVKYNMKNGEEVYRNYLINLNDEQVIGWLGDIYDDMEYKEGAYPVLSDDYEQKYMGVLLDYAYAEDEIPLSEEKMQKVVATYQKELKKLTMDEIRAEFPVAGLSFAVGGEDEESVYYPEIPRAEMRTYESGDFEYQDTEGYYYIYPSFTETIALLKEYGAKFANEIPVEDVVSVRIEDSTREVDDHDGLFTKIVELNYTRNEGEVEEIKQMMDAVVPSNLRGDFSYNKCEDYIYVTINYYYDGIERNQSVLFKKGMIPESILEDLEEASLKLQE